MGEKKLRVLIIEDNPDDVFLIEEMLHDEGGMARGHLPTVEIVTFGSVIDARRFLDNETVDVILLDLALPDAKGIDTIEKLEKAVYDVPTIVLTGSNDAEMTMTSLNKGVQEYLTKNTLTPELLLRSIRHSIERHKLLAALKSMSSLDELTGLYNRRGFISLATSYLKLSKRKNKTIALLFIDIDDMKGINDTYGHKEGDRALCFAAEILRDTLRDSDLIGRVGGDEFIAFLMDINEAHIEQVYTRLERNLEEIKKNKTLPFTLSLSYGAAFSAQDTAFSIDELIEQADKRMYEHKVSKSIPHTSS